MEDPPGPWRSVRQGKLEDLQHARVPKPDGSTSSADATTRAANDWQITNIGQIMYIQRNRWRMNRRTFLEAAGVSLALPWLEAMGVRSGSVTNAGEMTAAETPRRVYFSHWGF